MGEQTEAHAPTTAVEQTTTVTLPPPQRPSPPAIGLANLAEALESTTPSRRASLTLVQRAREKWQNREPEAAAAELRSALQLWGGNPYALYYLGILNLERGHYGEAAAQAQRAVSLWKQNTFWQARAYLLLSEARQKLGDAGGALEARQRAWDLDPRAELR